MRSVPAQPGLRLPFPEHHVAEFWKRISELLDRHADGFVGLAEADLLGKKSAERGRGAMSPMQVCRVVLIKQAYGFSYRDLEFHLVDSQTFRTFCRFGAFERTPKKSALQRDYNAISADTLAAINRACLGEAIARGVEAGDAVRIDCTAVACNVRAPTDNSLLEQLALRLLRSMRRAWKAGYPIGFVDRRKSIRRCNKNITYVRGKEKRVALYRRMISLVEMVRASAARAAMVLGTYDDRRAGRLRAELDCDGELCVKVLSQTIRRVLHGETVPVAEKIVSLHQQHTDVITKGRKTTFGHKVCLSVGRTLVLDAEVVVGNPSDSTLLVRALERTAGAIGRMPKEAAFDGGFESRANFEAAQERGVEHVVFTKARSVKPHEMAPTARKRRVLRYFRAGVEGVIGKLKHVFSMNRCMAQTFEGFRAHVMSSVLVANLMALARAG